MVRRRYLNRSSSGLRTISARTSPRRSHSARHAAHDRDRDARRLAHDQLGGGGELVDHRDLGDLHLAAVGVGRAAQVEDGADARAADGDVGEPAPPGATEGVAHDHGDVDAGLRLEAVADAPGRAIGVLGQQGGVTALDVGQVDAGVGAHEAVLRLADDEVAAAAQHAHRLALDERLVAQRIVGIDGFEHALGLRHDLLGDHHDVAVLQSTRSTR